MRSIVAGLGLALLAVSPPVKSASSARSALEDCYNVEVFMGQPVEISTGPVQVPQCVDNNDGSCRLLWFFCDDPEILRLDSIALASCSLQGDVVVPPLRFIVKSSTESLNFVPLFSGSLTCNFDGSQGMSESEIESRLPVETAKRYPCDGDPKPAPISGQTRVRCTERP